MTETFGHLTSWGASGKAAPVTRPRPFLFADAVEERPEFGCLDRAQDERVDAYATACQVDAEVAGELQHTDLGDRVGHLRACSARHSQERRSVDDRSRGAGPGGGRTGRELGPIRASRILPGGGRRDRCLLVLSQLAGVPDQHLARLTVIAKSPHLCRSTRQIDDATRAAPLLPPIDQWGACRSRCGG